MFPTISPQYLNYSFLILYRALGDGGGGSPEVMDRFDSASESFGGTKVNHCLLRPCHLPLLIDNVNDIDEVVEVPGKEISKETRKKLKKLAKSDSRWVQNAMCPRLGKARQKDINQWLEIGYTVDTAQFDRAKLFGLIVKLLKASAIHLRGNTPTEPPEKLTIDGKQILPYV